ncbi:MAG: coproporphyrinogen dehydrogenase HemZ [Oscillospiraceae bacterium]|nr:coproporphyrinogen dehydrogenase HemZ [Oscillospiraceae bacterium]
MKKVLPVYPYHYHVERIIRAFGFEPYDVPVFVFDENADKLTVCTSVYDRMAEVTGKTLPWGIFTGVRPIRFIRENRGQIEDFRISPARLALADEIIDFQRAVLPAAKNAVLLYVGIPFCPGRCAYCSFVSESVKKSYRLIPEYVDLLIRELQSRGEAVRERGFIPEAIYIGGGTPTSLPLDQQERIYRQIRELSPNHRGREYTIEAGRPETLTHEVIDLLKRSGANRISINPQSMNDKTLELIGRGHSSGDVYSAYERARRQDFDSVNMDLIAGLPGEDESAFADSLSKVIELAPENITVHSLAKKRSAVFAGEIGGDFTETAYKILKSAGYSPYYLYRMSNSAGDNIGYMRNAEKIGIYNVAMMDESVNVLGAGCGAATRIITDSGKIQKHYNPKYPYEYIKSQY